MANNPYVNKVQLADGTSLIDISDTTAVASDVLNSKYFYTATGEKVQGTATGGGGIPSIWQDSEGFLVLDTEGGVSPTLITKSITQNGTYNASSDSADGYSSVTVNVSGGGSTPKRRKAVNFIDYDGTIVESYSAAEALALNSLPSNPSHTGLTAQGWNYTLAEMKTQVNSTGTCEVGQMYTTSSGDTEIDVEMSDGRLNPTLTISVNGTVTVDWGDNTSLDTITGTSLTARKAQGHTYSSAGSYTIKIHATSGAFSFYGTSSYLILRKNTTSNQNIVYANSIKRIRLGNGITSIATRAFNYCESLESVTIPSGITSIGNYAFYYCFSLNSIIIPNTTTSIGENAFDSCNALKSIAIPSSVTSISTEAFAYCQSLESVTIPSGITNIGNYAFAGCYSLGSVFISNVSMTIGTNVFQNCRSLISVTIPSSVTSIGSYAFYICNSLKSVTIPSSVTSIDNYAFYNCYSLASITIPSGVTSIGNSVFAACTGMGEYHIQPTTPPTLGTSVFNDIVSDCVIYVPAASLTDYQTTTNWSNYASYMQGE